MRQTSSSGEARSRGSDATALGTATGSMGLDMGMSPDVIHPRIIAAMLARLFLIAVTASTVLLPLCSNGTDAPLTRPSRW